MTKKHIIEFLCRVIATLFTLLALGSMIARQDDRVVIVLLWFSVFCYNVSNLLTKRT